MNVRYLGRRSGRRNPAPDGNADVFELLWDNWDDFGYKTSFPVTCRIAGESVDLGVVRILIEGHTTSHGPLDELRARGWDGRFPPPELNFISVPSDTAFYQQLKARLGGEATIQIALALRDASYLVRVPDPAAQRLVDSEGFRNSLQRERGSVAAFLDGWRVLEDQAIAVQNFQFHFADVFSAISTLELNFASDGILPRDLNVLIGPNGAGKSRVLHQMVEAWVKPSDGNVGFATPPNLSQVVVVSYSPFERFPVDMEGVTVQDKDVYRYFGFRGRSGDGRDGPGKIRLSHEFPKANAAQSLIACLTDDQKFKAIVDWARKISTMEEVLRTAFHFDFAAVEVDKGKRIRSMYTRSSDGADAMHLDYDGKRYMPITSDAADHIDGTRLASACVAKAGVTFFQDSAPIELSSGQRLFAYIVINLLGVIRRNSLVLIDEPELFLHPTLEIQFVQMLKDILVSFNSKALLATHSEVIVREMPADCVHVLQRTDDGLVIRHPPFQTFGGDIQRISSYVFGDNVLSKPFEQWLANKLEVLGSPEALIDALGDDVSEELLVQIRAMER